MDDYLLQTLFVLTSVDGKIDHSEQNMIDCLRMTVSQLKGVRAPERITRQQLLDKLANLEDLKSRRQCFVLALEMALASGTINASEHHYLGRLQEALRLDDEFVTHSREVIAAKYRL
jgi:uncharacterized membrane protein YebE (DUF533 family)